MRYVCGGIEYESRQSCRDAGIAELDMDLEDYKLAVACLEQCRRGSGFKQWFIEALRYKLLGPMSGTEMGFDFFGHSVCDLKIKPTSGGGFSMEFDNQWGDVDAWGGEK